MDTQTLLHNLKFLAEILSNQYSGLKLENRPLKKVIYSFLDTMNMHRQALIALLAYNSEETQAENIRATFASFYSHYKSLRRLLEETYFDSLQSFDSHFVDTVLEKITSPSFQPSDYRTWLKDFVRDRDRIHVLYLRINTTTLSYS